MTTRSTRSPRRRTVVALAVVLAVLGAFIVRLVDIQVVNADDHVADSLEVALGDGQVLHGTRGAIVDASGRTLAGSILEYDCQLDPSLIAQIDDEIAAGESEARPWEEVSGDVAEITGQKVEDVRAIVTDTLAENPGSQYAVLRNGVSTETYRELMDLKTPYLACGQNPARAYPDGAVAGNLLGFVGTDGDALEGLERSYDQCLRATDGALAYQKGKDGVVIPGTRREQPAVDGGTLTLTIDRDLQWYMQQLIGEEVVDRRAEWGSIFVVDVNTGKIRAAAEYPTIDPNEPTALEGVRGSKIFEATFEPGSTFKGLTAATVVDAGGQHADSTVVASGYELFANGAFARDSFQHPAFTYTLTGVLVDSSNAGISKFSERVSPDVRYDYFRKLGIGSGSDVDFSGEETGYLHPLEDWDPQTTYNTAFGQGLTTTVPELAGAYAAIANGGIKVPLSLVESCTRADGTVVEPEKPEPTRVLKESTSVEMRKMLENVFLQSSFAPMVEIPGYRIAGKTGTGEKPDLVNGGYKRGVYFTTMLGFAPAEDPQYLVIVSLDEPKTVTSSAANGPTFQQAMTQVLKTYRVMPATSAPELLPKFG
ncbi:peptidoglycan D,D-transpeptidase FtsI family protein [Microbacterium insulae]|uniref:Peptidoglycan D,D-transpeptidase FtsI family protein n=1 Tax=Microbacterium insulae TaxID=483014 RepID=A0ABW3AKY8_9MICO